MKPASALLQGNWGGQIYLTYGPGLVTGAGAQPGMIGTHSDRADVSAFDLQPDHPALPIFAGILICKMKMACSFYAATVRWTHQAL